MSRSIRVRAPERLSAIPTSNTPAGDRATPKIRHSRRLWPWITFAGDIASLAGAFFIAYWLRYGLQFGPELTPFQFASLNAYWPVGVGFGATALLQLYLHGAYERGRRFRWLDESPKLINSLLFATAAVIVVFFLFRPAFFSRLMFGYLFVVSVGTLSASRVIVRSIAALRRRRGLDIDNVVVVGSGNAAKMLMQQMHAASGLGLRLVGFVDDARENGRDFGRFQRLGAVDELDELCDQHSLDRVFIALPPSASENRRQRHRILQAGWSVHHDCPRSRRAANRENRYRQHCRNTACNTYAEQHQRFSIGPEKTPLIQRLRRWRWLCCGPWFSSSRWQSSSTRAEASCSSKKESAAPESRSISTSFDRRSQTPKNSGRSSIPTRNQSYSSNAATTSERNAGWADAAQDEHR